jgi:prophage regulatory protein
MMQSNTPATPPTNFLRLPRVREIAGGVAPSTIWGWVKNGTFPKPYKLSSNCSAWSAEEVEAWAQARIAASLNQQTPKAAKAAHAR